MKDGKKHFLFFLVFLFGLLHFQFAYSESYTFSVGESVNIYQTAYNGGYIDNVGLGDYLDPHLGFRKNSDGSATITVNSYFDYSATVKLVFIERYQSYYNGRYHTLAYTYYKDVTIKCRYQAPEQGKKITKVILPERVRVNLNTSTYITPILEPYGAKATSYSWSSDNGTGQFVAMSQTDGQLRVTGRVPGIGSASVKIFDGSKYLTASTIIEVVDPNYLPPKEVILPSEIEISVNGFSTLTPILVPENTSTSFTWYSEDEDIATVSFGKVIGKKVGTTTIKLFTNNKLSTTCKVRVVSENGKDDEEEDDNITVGYIDGYEYVDLGLSVKWATCDVGSSSIDCIGKKYAWGETSTKTSFTWDNYKYCNGSILNVHNIGKDIKATGYDAAYVNWGKRWRMPTKLEIGELISKCTFHTITLNGVLGILITGPNGNCIFSPYDGLSYYWSSNDNGDGYANTLELYKKNYTDIAEATYSSRPRCRGYRIRPVTTSSEDTSIEPTNITLPESKTVTKKEYISLSPSLSPSNARRAIFWSSDDPSIATVSPSGIIKGVGVGSTNINVKTANGLTASCKVTVNRIEATEIMLDDTLLVYEGISETLSYKLTPTDAMNTITWKSDNPSIATVTPSEGKRAVISGVKEGTTMITVTADNGISASCKVTVEKKPETPKTIKLQYVEVEPGQTTLIRYKCEPAFTTTTIKSCKSNNTNIATVSSDGIVKGIRKGEAIITVTMANGLSKDVLATVGKFNADTYDFFSDTPDDCGVEYNVLDFSEKTCQVKYYWFDNQYFIKDIVIPSSVQGYTVTHIKGMSYLEYTRSITLPNTIRSIGSSAFNRTKLNELILPENLKTIEKLAFYNSGIMNITIPESIESIEEKAFMSCTNLKTLTMLKKEPLIINENTFGSDIDTIDIYKNTILYVPFGSKKLYAAAEGWKNFAHIIEDVDRITVSEFISKADTKKAYELTGLVKNVINAVSGNFDLEQNGSKVHISGILDNDCNVGNWQNLGVSEGDSIVVQGIYSANNGTPEIVNAQYVSHRRNMTVNLSKAGYATFYDSKNSFDLPKGLTAKVVTGVSDGRLEYRSLSDDVVPAGVAVMIAGNADGGAYTLTQSLEEATYSGKNILYGSDEATTTSGDGYHYKLAYGHSGTSFSNVFGWYWGSDNGGAFKSEAHRAWLVAPKSARTRSFSIEGETTDIVTAENDSSEEVWYDLQGRRIKQPTQRGVYIMNGKTIILK